jgi:hypothetical protein
MPVITIKRRTGASSYEELYPKTTPQQIDGLLVGGKIAQTYLPSYILGGLKYLGTQSLSTSTSLSTIFGGILGFATSVDDVAQKIGSYYIVSAGGELTSTTATTGSSAGYQLEPTGEEGDTTSGYNLEAGDWIVFRGETRTGSGGTLNLTYNFDIVNNTYADAGTSTKGVVTVSSSTSVATTGSGVITDSILHGLMGTTGTKIAYGNHLHTNVYEPANAALTNLASVMASLTTGTLVKTAVDTFGFNSDTYLSDSTSSTQNGYFGNINLRDDATPSHYLTLTASSNLLGNRTLALATGDADRTLTFGGNITTTAGSLTINAQAGGSTLTLPSTLTVGAVTANGILYGSSADNVGMIASTTIGRNTLQIPDISAISFARYNVDETISLLDASTFRTAIGAGTSSTTGTVTSVATDGLALTGGPITTTGTITHSTADGYKHVPANSTSNGGKFLVASGTAGTYSWEANTRLLYQDTAAATYDGDIVFEF